MSARASGMSGGDKLTSWGSRTPDCVRSERAISEVEIAAEALHQRLRTIVPQLRRLETNAPISSTSTAMKRAEWIAANFVLADIGRLQADVLSLGSQVRECVRDLGDSVADVHEGDVRGVGSAEAPGGDVPEQDLCVAGRLVDSVDPSHDSPSVETPAVFEHGERVEDTVGARPDAAAGTPSRAVSGLETHVHAAAGSSAAEIAAAIVKRVRRGLV